MRRNHHRPDRRSLRATGRTVQTNVKTTPEDRAWIHSYALKHGLTKGAVLAKARFALEHQDRHPEHAPPADLSPAVGVSRWMSARLDRDTGITLAILETDFRAWCAQHQLRPLKTPEFHRHLLAVCDSLGLVYDRDTVFGVRFRATHPQPARERK